MLLTFHHDHLGVLREPADGRVESLQSGHFAEPVPSLFAVRERRQSQGDLRLVELILVADAVALNQKQFLQLIFGLPAGQQDRLAHTSRNQIDHDDHSAGQSDHPDRTSIASF